MDDGPGAYRYRTLSPEARAALQSDRSKRGYPLHAPPHPHRESGWYLLTAANFEHRPLMHAPERRTEFQSCLLDRFRCLGAEIGGWVILPNYYHVLVKIESLDGVSECLRRLHGATARAWNLADGVSGRRRVWYKFMDRRIRDEDHYYQALNYIGYNPVKHGYAASPYLWAWSSVHLDLADRGRDWLRDR